MQNTSKKMKSALRAVKNGMSLRQASATFGVAKSTIHAHLNKRKIDEVRLEKSGKLSDLDEERLVEWLVYCHQMGFFQVSRVRLSEEAANLSKSSGSEQKFNKEWCKYFTHSQGEVKAAVGLYKGCHFFDKQSLEIWFRSLSAFCKDHKLLQCLENPQQLFHCCKLHITENLKMILSFSANGMATPPLLIAANLKDSDDTMGVFDNLVLPRGWVKYNCKDVPYHQDQDSIYHYYLEHILKSYLVQRGVGDQPILLFLKNESCPPKLPLYELSCHLSIFLANSYPTAFKLCQNLQNEIWSKIKALNDKQLSSLVDIVKEVLMSKLTKQKMSTSFRDSGIYPLDITQINADLLPRLPEKAANSEDSDDDTPDESCYIEHIDTAEIVDSCPQKRRRVISLGLEEFHRILGIQLVDALETALGDKSDHSQHSKEFQILLQIYRKFHLDNDDVEPPNESLLDDDPLSGINATIQVEPDAHVGLWE